MRKTLVVAALAALPLASGCGVLSHMYYGAGPALVPYAGHTLHPSEDVHLGFTLPQFPGWAVGLASTVAWRQDSSAFFEPSCYKNTDAEFKAGKAAGCHPTIAGPSRGLEVQYRWVPTRTIHPLVSVSLGQSSASYVYNQLGRCCRVDSTERGSYVAVSGGGELNLERWLHVSVAAGYRQASGQTLPHGTPAQSGLTLSSSIMFGVPSSRQP